MSNPLQPCNPPAFEALVLHSPLTTRLGLSRLASSRFLVRNVVHASALMCDDPCNFRCLDREPRHDELKTAECSGTTLEEDRSILGKGRYFSSGNCYIRRTYVRSSSANRMLPFTDATLTIKLITMRRSANYAKRGVYSEDRFKTLERWCCGPGNPGVRWNAS